MHSRYLYQRIRRIEEAVKLARLALMLVFLMLIFLITASF